MLHCLGNKSSSFSSFDNSCKLCKVVGRYQLMSLDIMLQNAYCTRNETPYPYTIELHEFHAYNFTHILNIVMNSDEGNAAGSYRYFSGTNILRRRGRHARGRKIYEIIKDVAFGEVTYSYLFSLHMV
jgi:hypothetical protein